MSIWYEPKDEDIELDGDEINIYVHSNDSGSVYAVLKVEKINELIKEYKERLEQKLKKIN